MLSNNYDINVKMIFKDPKTNTSYTSFIEQELSHEAFQIINTFNNNEIIKVFEIFGCLDNSYMNQIEAIGMLIVYLKNSDMHIFSTEIDENIFYNENNENNEIIKNHEIIKLNQYMSMSNDSNGFPYEYLLESLNLNI
jgi:hypothetical protein